MQRICAFHKLVSWGFSNRKWKWELTCRSGNVQTETKRRMERWVSPLQVKTERITVAFKKIRLFKYAVCIASLLGFGFGWGFSVKEHDCFHVV